MKARDAAGHAGRGAVMGLADLVPGVSGGTMALLLGIHPRLVAAIAAWSPASLALLTRLTARRPRDGDADSWRRHDAPFLLALGVGLLAAIFVGATGLEAALHRYPVGAMAIFTGLLAASIRVPWRLIREVRITHWLAALAAAALAASLSWLPATSLPASWPWLVGAGAIAITAMLLPGISGSGLLLLVGAYEVVLAGAANRDLAVLAPFAVGAGLGMMGASRALRWLFRHQHDTTMAALTGLIAGAMTRVWPWRSEHGFAAGTPHWPAGPANAAALVVLFVALGAAVVVLIERAGKRRLAAGFNTDA